MPKSDSIKKYMVVLSIVLIIAVFLFLVFYKFYAAEGPDENLYSIISYTFMTQGFHIGYGIDSIKPIIIAGTALMFKLFGVSAFSEILFDVIMYGAGILMLFLLGRKLHSTQAGILSALFYSTLPLGIYQVAREGDDAVMATFAILAMLLFVYAMKGENKRRNYLMFLLAGFTAIIGALVVAETMLILLPMLLVLIYLTLKEPQKQYYLKSIAFTLAGAALAVAVMIGIGFLAYGAPLYIIQGMLSNYSGISKVPFVYGFYAYLVYMFPIGTALVPISGITYLVETGGYFYIVIVMSLVVLLYRDHRAALPVLWLISLILYLSFGTESLTHYLQIDWGVPYLRYLMIVMPAVSLIFGMGFADLFSKKASEGRNHLLKTHTTRGFHTKRTKNVILIILIGAIMASNVFFIYIIKMSMYNYAYSLYNLGKFIDTLPVGSSLVLAPLFINQNEFTFLLEPYTDYQYQFVTNLNQTNCTTLGKYEYIITLLNNTLQQRCNLDTVYVQVPSPSYLRKYDIFGQPYSMVSTNNTLIGKSFNFTYAVYKIPVLTGQSKSQP